MKIFLVSLLLLVGCAPEPAFPVLTLYKHNDTLRSTGPVKVVTSVYDYHETLEKSDGEQFEFYQDAYTSDIQEIPDAYIEIQYTGDYTSDAYHDGHFDAHIVKIFFIPRKGHWAGSKYVLDSTKQVCGTIHRDDEFYSVEVEPHIGRHSLYETVTDYATAKVAVEKECV